MGEEKEKQINATEQADREKPELALVITRHNQGLTQDQFLSILDLLPEDRDVSICIPSHSGFANGFMTKSLYQRYEHQRYFRIGLTSFVQHVMNEWIENAKEHDSEDVFTEHYRTNKDDVKCHFDFSEYELDVKTDDGIV